MTEQVLVPARPLAEPPAGACRLYLVRHGTTTLNVENRYRGRRDIPLDAQGYQDAVDAARHLSGVGLAAVSTGPLGERLSDAQQRMIDALQLIGSRHAGEAVAAVTHAVMIRLILVALGGTDGENWRIPVGR